MSLLHREIRSSASRVRAIRKSVLFSDLAAAAMTGFVDFTALPTGALIIGAGLSVVTDFDDGSPGTATNKVDLGVAGTLTKFMVGAADNLGTVGEVEGGTAGTHMPSYQSGATVRATFTSSVNLNTLTKGQVDITILYVRASVVGGDDR
jgi:hypothetical protein